jgi:hypothetical protein
MNYSPASTPAPGQQKGPPEQPLLNNGGQLSQGSTENYQTPFQPPPSLQPGRTGSVQHLPTDVLPTSESGRRYGVLLPASSQTDRPPVSRNPTSESTREQYPGTTETLHSGSTDRLTSEQLRPYRLGQGVIASTPAVNTVRYVRL